MSTNATELLRHHQQVWNTTDSSSSSSSSLTVLFPNIHSTIGQTVLSCNLWLEQWGAWEWNLYLVAIVATLCFATIRALCHKAYGIDWYCFIHAIVSSLGSCACVYLDWYVAPYLTTTTTTSTTATTTMMMMSNTSSQPLFYQACLCAGPMTTLHRIVPSITLGYAVFDALDGLSMSWDFALHGLGTCFVMLYFLHYQATHIVVVFLIMEVSTIFLTIVRAEFFTNKMALANQLVFASTFFLFRIVLSPFLWFQLLQTMAQTKDRNEYQDCFPSTLFGVSVIFGILFHLLNLYWFVKIVKKAKRKLTGTEHIKANNALEELDKTTTINNEKKHV